ncbi:MAG: S49 family peptidase, partial [Legionellaceae bacterium]
MTNIDKTDQDAVLTQLVRAYVRDQKRNRLGRFLFRLLLLTSLGFIGYALYATDHLDRGSRMTPHVGLIDLQGTIADSQPASAENFIAGLADAYDNEHLKALVVRIESPGGSPVQADYMYNALHYYRKKYPDIKVYAVCVDMCASAAYYVAAAADEIYANPSSMVGSIGVIYNGFGFVDTLQKIGVSRRVQTAGQNKAFLDQFSPVKPEDEATLQVMLDLVHQQFIDKVKTGRGDRLKIDSETFSG